MGSTMNENGTRPVQKIKSALVCRIRSDKFADVANVRNKGPELIDNIR